MPEGDANDGIQLYAAGDKGNSVTDTTTVDNWQDFLTNDEGDATTQNIGRIWTDKSVYDEDIKLGEGPLSETPEGTISKGDSDFLVGLSALSSTSNLTTTVQTSQPLDIVLVLDTSGSMDDDFGAATYMPTYNVWESWPLIGWFLQQDYYALMPDGSYQQITEEKNFWGTHQGWKLNGNEVWPKENANDTAEGHIQFYIRSQSCLSALKYSVNNFIDATAAENATIEDPSLKHNISIVSFGSNASTVSGLQTCEGEEAESLKESVMELGANGATNAEAGMERAESILTGAGARDNAQKVVIFFTDGVPTTSSTFSNSVANGAVQSAYRLKQNEDTLVYSIGVFENANPDTISGSSESDRANQFMNAVSSNYPSAQEYNDLDNRASDADYYKSATDVEELNNVFQEIAGEITDTATSGSPIQSTVGVQGEIPGTLTFTDPLGQYMKVTGDTMTLVYGDKTYTANKQDDGSYSFGSQTAAGNAVYPGDRNLSDIKITVTPGEGSNGDMVKVEMPASFIPLRNYQIDTNTGAMSVTPAYPIRLFYGVSVSQNALGNLANPDNTQLQGYVQQHPGTTDGTVVFYANDWAAGSQGAATATFTPSAGNKFYYYTENTPLYLDEACTQPATENNVAGHEYLYFKDAYWVQTGDSAGQNNESGYGTIGVNGQDYAKANPTGDRGQLVIPAGTQRSDRPSTLNAPKDDTTLTGTATNVLEPAWAGTSVSQHLGNNGKLDVELPGTLTVSKTATVAEGFNGPADLDNVSFPFTLALTGAPESGDPQNPTIFIGKVMKSVDGELVQQGGDITFTATGGDFSLKNGETLYVYGLSDGMGYTVTEGTMPNGFEQTNKTGETGTIVAGQTTAASFTNEYSAEDVSLTDAGIDLRVQKNLVNRDWREGDVFTFGVATGNSDVTIENANGVEVTDGNATSLGNITFSKPGTYEFTVTEDNDTNPIAGLDYSTATYTVTVVVSDDGDGTLSIDPAEITIRQTNPNATETATAEGVMVFTNTYDVASGSTAIDGVKNYTDNSGNNPLNEQNKGIKFQFKLTPVGGYETEGGNIDAPSVAAEDVPMPQIGQGDQVQTVDQVGIDQITQTGGTFQFPNIYFDGNDAGKTFVYDLTEVVGTEAAAGMTYDTATTHRVEIVVEEQEGADGELHIVATPQQKPADLVFSNVYDPKDAELTTDQYIKGTKVLDGRGMNDGEKFFFTLTAVNDNAKRVLTDPKTVAVDGTNGMGFNFGAMSFDKVGEYTFTVTETKDENGTALISADNAKGMTYSANVCTVTINVTDDGSGTLQASDPVYSNTVGTDNTQAVFTNTYRAQIDYGAAGGIQVSKVLNGRPMNANEFSFSITGAEAPEWLKADLSDKTFADAGEAAGKLNSSEGADATFSNEEQRASGVPEVMNKLKDMTFTQSDANKVFAYRVAETSTGTETVTVDSNSYYVIISVSDNGDGSMSTDTYVVNTNAGSLENPVAEASYSSAQSATNDDAVVVPFVNTYTPKPAVTGEYGNAQIQVTKKVTGADAAETFDFDLTLKSATTSDGQPISDGVYEDATAQTAFDGMHVATSNANMAEDSTETLTFKGITFTKAGIYTFEVKEATTSDVAYWQYDNAPKEIVITVADPNYNGQLEVTKDPGNNPTIENKYVPVAVELSDDDALKVQKTVTGHDSTEGFNFKLEPVVEQGDEAKWGTVELVDSEYDGTTSVNAGITEGSNDTASFGGIRFKAEGTFKFKVTEFEAHDGVDDPDGWTYDTHESFVTVTVTDDGQGQLKAAVSYDNTGATTDADKGTTDAAAFTNSYSASGSLDGDAEGNLTVTKNYTSDLGDPWTPDDSFGFWLEADMSDADTKTAVDNGWIELPANAGSADAAGISITDESADHQASFGDIAFSHAGTFQFKVHEVLPEGVTAESPTKNGITYDTSSKVVTVNVTDNNDGTLTATVDADGSDELTFNNTYSVGQVMFRAAYFKLQGNKVLDGRTWEQGDEFTFTLTAGVSEINGETVQPNDQRVLDTMPAKRTDTINPLADGSVDNGGSMVDNNSAQFTFTDERWTGGTTVPEDQFTFSEPGTYRYLIQETNPNQAKPGSGILGVTYDQTTYRLEVIVVNNGNGTLKVDSYSYSKRAPGEADFTPIADSSAVTFTNVYNTESVGVTFNAAKVLEGRKTAMADNEFQFHMEFAGWKTNDAFDADPASTEGWQTEGDVAAAAPKAAADANNIIRGDVTFADVTFTKDHVGNTYRYAITEVIPADATNEAFDGVTYGEANADQKAAAGWEKDGITYDGSTKYVTARVTTEEKGDQSDPDATVESIVRVQTAGEATLNDGATDTTGTFSGGAIFTNTYKADPGTVPDEGDAEQAFNLTKQFTGRDGNAWLDTDEFSFTLTGVDGAPMPADSDGDSKTVTVGADDVTDAENGIASIEFGGIQYDQEGTYTYTVTEANGGKTIDGITYANNTVGITVTVTDNGHGDLVAAVAKTGEGATASFVNTYDSTIDYSGAEGHAGLEITKTLENRDMTAGQFTIEVTAADDASAEKLGAQTAELKSTAAVAGEAAPVATNPFDGMTFDRDDAGKTFTYTIAEKNDGAAGYQYDSDVYTVSITPRDNGDGTMTVSTQVSSEGGYNEQTEGVATVPFVNTYDAGDVTVGAEGDATIVATKVLENDDIANYAGMFGFKVTSGDVTVAEGTNNADGSITFDTITYTSANLYAAAHGGSDEVGTATLDATGNADVYTFNYTVSENPVTVDGVVNKGGNDSSVTVTVTDDRAGKLSIEVAHKPSADGLVFTNAYGTGTEGTTELTLAGNKNLTGVDGATAPALEDGMFEFIITGEDGAPMPETVTVGNVGKGISFGPITYSMEDVFGAQETESTEGEEVADEAAANEGIETYTAGRSKVYTYTITETNAGETIEGITYDGASKTVEVTVTDEGDGKISAAVTKVAEGADENMDFTFNNTYSVTPEESSPTEGEGALTFTKVWDRQGGTRELAEGDFTFQLTDASGKAVATGTNDAKGNVEMSAIEFTKAGEYSYTLTEVVPEGAQPVDGGYEKDGVFYPNVSYSVTAKVTDNHDGTLGVGWSMTDAGGENVTEATFANMYSVSETTVTFGAAKALEGRAVKDGEFTFELRDAQGNVLGTATNDAEGQIVFADAVQTFGSAGEYDFVIAEVLPEDDDAATEGIQKDGVTYDETTYAAHVVVSDDNKGNLVVTELTYNGEAALPVFHNTYVEPEEPVAPAPEEPAAEPEEPKFAQTNDSTPWMLIAGIAVVAAVAVAAGAVGLLRTRRR